MNSARERLVPLRRPASDVRRLLNLDTAYSLEIIRARGMDHDITCRDLGGFFEHVWNVHPAVGSSPEHSPETAVGPPSEVRIAPRHTVIEGKVGRFRWLRGLPRLNFTLAQTVLMVRLLWLIWAERITIIRASEPFYTGLLGLVLSRASGLPLVVRVNANEDYTYEATGQVAFPRLIPSRRLQQRVARFVLSRADLVAAGNENNRQFALDSGAPAERSTLFRVGTFVDPVHFNTDPVHRRSMRAELDVGERPFMILVSRLAPIKFPEDVLGVLAKAKARHPDLVAVFVGDGEMRGRLESAAADMGLAEDVRFVGNRDQEWIAAALASADVVLSPLTGRALVEACLSGTPVVAYDVEWHSELVISGETGILVPYRSIEKMAEGVCTVLEDQRRAAAIGQKARAATLEMMDPDRLMAHERTEYLRLLGARRA